MATGVTQALFLPGVPEAYVRNRLEQADGDEIGSVRNLPFAAPLSNR